MLFHSFEYAVFLPVVFILYWFFTSRSFKLQNLLLLATSYFFYGWWDWRFLSLIIISSSSDFLLGQKIYNTTALKEKKYFLILSIVINLGLLGVFKYYNFFVDSFIQLFLALGISLEPRTLNVVLPVGISFYTFQTMSYTIDIYRGHIQPTRNRVAFFTFVSFFPQLVAGPIERASNLLPQFLQPRTFNLEKSKDGLRQILWGLFKKVVIADTLGQQVELIFTNHSHLHGITLIAGAVFFAFQVYCDFSAYSDIALGSARLLGFTLMRNFNVPYFSRNIAEFWRRWHISLSSWFRDYVFYPLGGPYGSKLKQIRNVIITFTVSGFWHGANWTFICWGLLHGLYIVPSLLFKSDKPVKARSRIVAKNRKLPSLTELMQLSLTFSLVTLAWVFFRSDSIENALLYIQHMFSFQTFNLAIPAHGLKEIFLIIALVIVEWVQRKKQHGLQIDRLATPWRWVIYLIVALVVVHSFGAEQPFIYFQF